MQCIRVGHVRVWYEGTDRYGREGEVVKPTMIMTNSPETARMLETRCRNNRKQQGQEQHEHVQLVGGLAKQAQVYPRKCCRIMCERIAAQRRGDELMIIGLPPMSLGEVEDLAARAQKESGRECEPMDALHERTPQDESIMAYDDVSGEEPELNGVRQARKEEIAYFRSMKVYEMVPIQESHDKTGKATIYKPGGSTSTKATRRSLCIEVDL